MNSLARIQTLFGIDAINKLKNTTVMVVGCGAVGSFAIEALARSGIGHLIIVDFDVVEESNINRQIFATTSTIGQAKVDVASKRIHDINPNAVVTAHKMFWDENTDINDRPDFVIDAIDTVDSKISLYKWAEQHNLKIIACMGAASKTDVSRIKIAPLFKTSVCPLAQRVRQIARKNNISNIPTVFSDETPVPVVGHAKNLGSIITVTGTFGLTMANDARQEIIQKK